jgi:uncharacterized DUF497 family protein
MDFEWDEEKRKQIIADRALDFDDADLFFDGRPVSHQSSPRGGKPRRSSRMLFSLWSGVGAPKKSASLR